MKTLKELKNIADNLKLENPKCRVFVVGCVNSKNYAEKLSVSFNPHGGNTHYYEA